MARLPGRLGTLCAGDIMTKNVIVLSETDSIPDAVATLKKHDISGAPVVDQRGRFVGLLSVSDLVPTESSSGSSPASFSPLAHGRDTTTWDLFEKANILDEEKNDEQVSRRMTQKTVSVTVDAPLVEVARKMCDGHWHRLPVVDENGTLLGIISTMDVLAALVNVADEAE